MAAIRDPHGSQAYLDKLDKASHDLNIDYFHLYRANHRISAWFRTQGDPYVQEHVASRIHDYLFSSVRVIWYEAPDNADANALFTRLNIGRIPLTDAELFKAALLSAVHAGASHRAHEIAAQWDGIERDLHHAQTWAFVAGPPSDERAEKYSTRISLLLDTLADEIAMPVAKRPRYYTFDTLRSEIEQQCSPDTLRSDIGLRYAAFWKKVVALHALILGWRENHAIFNKIGFLVASGSAFGELALASKGKKKSEFEDLLVERIRQRINVKEAELEELSYDDKKRGYPKILQLLMLFNVETATRSGIHFPFFRHVGQKWSLEHIHAQNAETLNKADQWKTWLKYHKPALDAVVAEADRSEIAELKGEIDKFARPSTPGIRGNSAKVSMPLAPVY